MTGATIGPDLVHPFPGVVSCDEWLGTPAGDLTQRLWAPCWRLVTDAMVAAALEAATGESVGEFKSREGWALVAYPSFEDANAGAEPLALVPGCKVAGWVRCYDPPSGGGVLVLGRE